MKTTRINGPSFSFEKQEFDDKELTKKKKQIDDLFAKYTKKRKDFNWRFYFNNQEYNTPKHIDTNPKHMGFVYVVTTKESADYSEPIKKIIKIGNSKNPLFRIATHKYKTFKGSFYGVNKVCYCYDYLKCEAEIKKLTDGKEFFSYSKTLLTKIWKIIDKYTSVELDTQTITKLLEVGNLKNYKFK
jgi:hypothetical protein